MEKKKCGRKKGDRTIPFCIKLNEQNYENLRTVKNRTKFINELLQNYFGNTK